MNRESRDRDTSNTLTCKVCTNPFFPRRNYKYRKSLPKYCSTKCRDKDRKSFSGNWEKAMVNRWNGVKLTSANLKDIRSTYGRAKKKREPLMRVIAALAKKYKRSPSTIESIIYRAGKYKLLT